MNDPVEHLATWYRKSEQVSPVRIRTLTRKRLIQHFDEWELRAGVEIGVDGGTFSRFMFQHIPDLELAGVDPWERNPPKEQQADEALKGFNWHKFKGRSIENAAHFNDGSLDFVYIDGSHTFDDVMLDLILWSPKVRPGGIVAGHDYYRFRGAGVVPAVDCYTREHGITQWFLTDERHPTFFWVKR